MATLLNRVWLCALDLDDWELVAALVHPANYPSPRLPEDARIAAAVSAALVRVAIHEVAGPTFEAPARVEYAQRRAEESILPLDEIQHSISHAPGGIAVAVGLGTLGVDVEPSNDLAAWRRARGKAAIKASGAALLGSERHLELDMPGKCEVGGNTLWVSDVQDADGQAIALAAEAVSEPVVVRTSAREILERYREIFDRAAAVESNERVTRVRRFRQA